MSAIETRKKEIPLLKVMVPLLPSIKNQADFEGLSLYPNVDFQFIQLGDYIPIADLIILPDSKNARADLQYLKDFQWERALTRHLRAGGKLLGIGGGFQMLGNAIYDPDGIEGLAGSDDAFGWLLMETRLAAPKQQKQVSGQLSFVEAGFTGYESDTGDSVGDAFTRPALWIEDKGTARPEGAVSMDNQVVGTFVSGLLDHAEACGALLKWAGYVSLA